MSWYHTIELPDGTVTPGFYDTRGNPDFIPWPKELVGGRCLDVGTFDGFWTFTMEQRGAGEVVSLDLADPHKLDWDYDRRIAGPKMIEQWRSERGTGYRQAHAALGSNATWIDQSVYDLDPQRNGMFDVVFCGALLQHLRDPVRALEAMRSVCRGALVLAEGLEPKLELLTRRIPAARFVMESDQWWRANSAGLAGMAKRAGFTIDEVGPRYVTPFGQGSERDTPPPKLDTWLARGRGGKGVLHRALRATPRPPRDAV